MTMSPPVPHQVLGDLLSQVNIDADFGSIAAGSVVDATFCDAPLRQAIVSFTISRAAGVCHA
jgi:hypothetical protein